MRLNGFAAAAFLLLAPSTALASDNQSILEEMAEMIEPCVQRTQNARVFILCYDTHSSIHAHWAAYRIGRMTSSLNRLAETSHRALNPLKLAREVTNMRYPYAAAWFLRLSIEYEKWTLEYGWPDPYRLRTFGDQMAAWLMAYYQTRVINPYLGEYDNPSWVFYQLNAYYKFTGDTAMAARTDTQIRNNFHRRITNRSFASDLNNAGFFSVYGNWLYLMARTQKHPRYLKFRALQQPIQNGHLAVPNQTSVHSYGLLWSRVWAFRAMKEVEKSPAERRRLQQAIDQHIAVGMARHEQLKGNFLTYDHWVPQFAVYAITEGLGADN